jgi:hypothetical protein
LRAFSSAQIKLCTRISPASGANIPHHNEKSRLTVKSRAAFDLREQKNTCLQTLQTGGFHKG